ncbi:MAG: hypothetical protein OEV08_07165 [Nitrospira sp.]|nr:hypothetical protein [Nitrospira sp.]
MPSRRCKEIKHENAYWAVKGRPRDKALTLKMDDTTGDRFFTVQTEDKGIHRN